MKAKLLCIAISSVFLFSMCTTNMYFTASEEDAEIFIDGEAMGRGQSPVVKLSKGECYNVKVQKAGFLTEEARYCWQGATVGKPKNMFIALAEDDAYNASIQTDYANKDFEVTVRQQLNEGEAWKVISHIVTSYFDNLEMADKATGYMKTSWQSKSFTRTTIRSRIIVKQSSTTPLKYKIKIISECSKDPNQSVKDDDKFKEWDRVLRAYEDVVTEFQSRLKQM